MVLSPWKTYIPAECGPARGGLIFANIKELWDSFSNNLLHCLQNIISMCEVDTEQRRETRTRTTFACVLKINSVLLCLYSCFNSFWMQILTMRTG